MSTMFRPPARGDLVRTDAGEFGLLLGPGPDPETWVVAMGNGVACVVPACVALPVPLTPGSPCPASFAEWLAASPEVVRAVRSMPALVEAARDVVAAMRMRPEAHPQLGEVGRELTALRDALALVDVENPE